MRVSVKELLRNFSLLSDKALAEPVIITKNGRDRLVLVSVEEYSMMRDMIGASPASSSATGAAHPSDSSAAGAKPKTA
jgi:prevent-host-death family protein